ncbi:MAG: zinc ABC transporter substrate-binding protein [Oricola sp.]
MKLSRKLSRTLLLATCVLVPALSSARADVKVLASIKPVHSLVAAVMQGAGEPGLIVEGAASPHTYSLKPSQAAAMQDADVVFWIGEALEAFLQKPIETIGSGIKADELIEAPGLETLGFREGGAFEPHMDDGEEEDAHEDGHDHADIDPHVWLDPQNTKALTAEIARALGEADPANAALYTANSAALDDKLDALTAEIASELAPAAGKGFIVFHDGYQYFEHRFGLTAAGSITVTPDLMPGAERLTEIRAKVKELGATCVFSEPQFESKLINLVTEGTDARPAVLDPLGAAIEPGPELYFTLMRTMAKSVSSCLSGSM